MSEVVQLDNLVSVLKSPYKMTKSILGTTTKVMSEKFICSAKELNILVDKMNEKIVYFHPTKVGFQYLASFTDKTHFENNDLSLLEKNLSSTGKSTDKLILNWVVTHEHDGCENELEITVRISNPINPLVMLQAALSRTPGEIDSLELESGSVSISISGATQTASEEVFELVGRWVDASPKPQNIMKINLFITKYSKIIHFVNMWCLPVLFLIAAFLFIQGQVINDAIAYSAVFICGFFMLRTIAGNVNYMISEWCQMSRMFSLFNLTGGDLNQQTRLSAKATNSAIKLISSVSASFILNVLAGFFVANLFSS
jgi:hypothetical protein